MWLRSIGMGDLTADGGNETWGVWCTDATVQRIATATGVATDDIRRSLITALPVQWGDVDWSDPAQVRKAAAGAPVWLGRHRVSPLSLADRHGATKIAWHSKLLGVDGDNGCYLVNDCPDCKIQIGTGRDGRLAPVRPDLVPEPGHCNNLVRTHIGGKHASVRLCGFDLTTIEPEYAKDHLVRSARVFEAMVNAYIDGTFHAYVQERWERDIEDPDAYFKTLHAVGALWLWCAPESAGGPDNPWNNFVAARDADGKGGMNTWTGLHDDPKVMATVLAEAQDIVLCSAAMDDSMAQLAGYAAARWKDRRSGKDGLENGFGLPEPWLASYRNAVGKEMRRFTSLSRHAAFTMRLPSVNIPAHLPEDMYEPFAGLIPSTADRTRDLFLSMAAVKVLDGASWGDAAELLGVPRHVGVHKADVVVRRITEVGTGDRVWSGVGDLIDTLSRRSSPDYDLRKAMLAGLTEVPEGLWKDLCDDAGVHIGRNGARRRCAAAWLWETFGGSDYRWSPAMLTAEACGADRDSLREVYRRYEAWLPDRVAAGLLHWMQPPVEVIVMVAP